MKPKVVYTFSWDSQRYRIVSKPRVYVLERSPGDDAMGDPVWIKLYESRGEADEEHIGMLLHELGTARELVAVLQARLAPKEETT